MFHVNAWGLPYVACMAGAKLVFPPPDLDGKLDLRGAFESEKRDHVGRRAHRGRGCWRTEAQGLRFSTMRARSSAVGPARRR